MLVQWQIDSARFALRLLGCGLFVLAIWWL